MGKGPKKFHTEKFTKNIESILFTVNLNFVDNFSTNFKFACNFLQNNFSINFFLKNQICNLFFTDIFYLKKNPQELLYEKDYKIKGSVTEPPRDIYGS